MSGRQKLVREFQVLGLATLFFYSALFFLSGCRAAPPSDQQLKDQAAQTTEQVRQGAKEAAADAKVAAANAEQKVNAIADGVKEGMKSPSSSDTASGTVDINSASTDQLAALPGISGDKAEEIVSKRPYSTPHKLVSKGLITEAEYHRIAARITAS